MSGAEEEMTHDGPRTNGEVPRTTATPSRTAPVLPDICYTLRRKVTAFLEQPSDDQLVRDTQAQARVAMGVIKEALQSYTHDQISLAYNGGKDCLVLLLLILACLPSTSAPPPPPTKSSTVPPTPHPPQRLQAIYIAPPDPFPEVEAFVAASTQTYHLDLERYALPMRPALEAYIRDRPAVRAVFMGTRRTDPHSEFLEHFSPTDGDWPRIMRVNPLLDWRYAEIWAFIRMLGVEFCCLYDKGYSSLGGVNNTRPNPVLALDAEGKRFRPAYELVRDEEERLGRDR